jgi:hypothetical protein
VDPPVPFFSKLEVFFMILVTSVVSSVVDRRFLKSLVIRTTLN